MILTQMILTASDLSVRNVSLSNRALGALLQGSTPRLPQLLSKEHRNGRLQISCLWQSNQVLSCYELLAATSVR